MEEEELEEEEYDALNDETFGPDATIGDWEEDHEKLAKITESNRLHNQSATSKKVCCYHKTLFSLIIFHEFLRLEDMKIIKVDRLEITS